MGTNNPLKSVMQYTGRICTIALISITLTACTSVTTPDGNINDPLEPINRVVFSLNNGLDTVILEPAAYIYRYSVPEPARHGAHNILQNLKSPIHITNSLLQGDLDRAGNSTKRMLYNTIMGFGGLFDVASYEGIPYQPEDFGQTLAKWGVGDGAYIVLPIIGPSTLRDAAGLLTDSLLDPVNYAINQGRHEELIYYRTGTSILDTRERTIETLDDLKANSGDYYATLRSIYTQHRHAAINNLDESGISSTADIPDYDDE